MAYYFLILALPALSFDKSPEVSFKELRELLILNLTASDLKKLDVLLRSVDLYNMRAFWLGEPLSDRGNLSAKELEEVLLVRDEMLPSYILDFLSTYEETSERLQFYSLLKTTFYKEEAAHLTGFLQKYYVFEHQLSLVLTALRAKVIHRDLVKELQFEDMQDPFVVELLSLKDSSEFYVPQGWEQVARLFQEYSQSPKMLGLAMLEYRFNRIEELCDMSSFSIDQVLGYVARFLILDEWFHWDMEKGKKIAEKLSRL